MMSFSELFSRYRLIIGLVLLVIIFFLIWFVAWCSSGPLGRNRSSNIYEFNGLRAFGDVEYQVSLGPRISGNKSHDDLVSWLVKELRASKWTVSIQESIIMDKKVRNVIGKYGSGRPWIILGAHYDTRLYADRDPEIINHTLPVPGANDGASGVAVLVELSRLIPQMTQEASQPRLTRAEQIWLVFFDAEDNGGIEGTDWILGSRAFVAQLDENPDAVVIVDMVGDRNLNIYQELNSDRSLTDSIWASAAELGFSNVFIPEPGYSILDDHIPFLEAGIPAVDIIDFDYPYWHTTYDTIDKVSWKSLKIVGDTLVHWLSHTE